MGEILPITATIATIYTNFWAFVLMSIYSFSEDWKGSQTNADRPADKVNYGTALLVLAAASLATGLTSGDPDEPLFRAVFLCLTAVWASRGLYHVVDSNATISPLPVGEGLFPGYGAFLLIFLVFTAISLLQKSKHIAILSFCLSLACVFEIVSFWEPLSNASGAYYVLCGAILIHNLFRYMNKRRINDEIIIPERLRDTQSMSVDYVVVGNAMNVVCSSVFASHVTGITQLPSNSFTWVLMPGVIQVICGVVSLRRHDAYHGCHFSLYGVFWTAIGATLAEEYLGYQQSSPLIAVHVFFIIVFLCSGIFSASKELFVSVQNITFSLFCIALCTDGLNGQFLGTMGWINLVLSLYGLAAHLTRVLKCSTKLPLGRHLFESSRIQQSLVNNLRCCASCIYGRLHEQQGQPAKDNASGIMLGYSKYADLDMIGFFCNAVAGLAILWVPVGFNVLTVPWVFGIGGLIQFLVGCVSFSRGKTFESCAFIVFSCLWLIWGTSRGFQYYEGEQCIAVAVGCIAFLLIGILLLLLSAVISKAWFVATFLFNMVVIAFLVDSLQVQATHSYEVVVILVFAAVSLYCFLACFTRSVLGRELLPLGAPIFNVSYLHAHSSTAIWANAKRDTGVTKIAEILNNGGICGIPSDVVYILVAACKYPHSVERAYNTKKQAEERPMSMWISSLTQIEAGRGLFGELTWSFMKEVWPSTISLVVNKGPWLQTLGIGESEKYIGRPDSIAVRMPDNTITTHLIDKTGPVAVSSANPTGEADTTHHLQVLAKLGPKNCDGILCDGPSHENAASTVVDCRQIDEGKLGFFRVGIVPKSKVQEIFDEVQQRFRQNGMKSRSSSVSSSNQSRNDSGLDDQSQGGSPREGRKGSSKSSRKSSGKSSTKSSVKRSNKTKHTIQVESQIEGTANPAFVDDDEDDLISVDISTAEALSDHPSVSVTNVLPAGSSNNSEIPPDYNTITVESPPVNTRPRRRDSTSGESEPDPEPGEVIESSNVQVQVRADVLNQEDATSSL